MITDKQIKAFENKINYKFQNKQLLRQALTHSSFSNERKMSKLENNERIEFLGDAVLELVTSHFLFENYPKLPEGELTKLRASIVCEPTLSECAKDLQLGQYILLGKGEELSGGRARNSVLSDVLEAVIGAIYLDSGLDEVRTFIKNIILTDIENKKLFYDSKTVLQEIIQQNSQVPLQYRLIEEKGPDHNKEFVVEVIFEEKVLGIGKGRSKKMAEQEAAYKAIKSIQNHQNKSM
ncbi:ribonuclease-3 [Natranaerovirga hydrolytica]|uniref:Ribonuclease 3 n=1 Tax=Natranaerovirga hydrolytica TaxID=680378 RepID=A0A4R1N0D1_9FIRM|nr:ribonuclease III [Natranaerovirga hydrolytica]TCK98312.1 ribonuclease-3 [Natranaerovirga hydrolytica]